MSVRVCAAIKFYPWTSENLQEKVYPNVLQNWRMKSARALPRRINLNFSGTAFSNEPRELEMICLSCSILTEVSGEEDSGTPYIIKLGRHLSCSKFSCRT
ncbi:uncharacterized protein LOC112680382 [Sipha flava]|uniref:Uncharacterized protein LOC112680382 n=1 Tax=Sipha flava TaxID=143950 RepID=A0A8B8F6X6_9HEMI|nr:uncharacterized protein LOC112680382 [Sipha flava]XP_025406252.1 uncharacterized protein LOC112680382 [Sipha flava]